MLCKMGRHELKATWGRRKVFGAPSYKVVLLVDLCTFVVVLGTVGVSRVSPQASRKLTLSLSV